MCNVQISSPRSERCISRRWKTTHLASLGAGGANQRSRSFTAMGTQATHARASANRFPFWKPHSDVRPSQSYKWRWSEAWKWIRVQNIIAKVIFRAFFTRRPGSTCVMSHPQILHRKALTSHTSWSYFQTPILLYFPLHECCISSSKFQSSARFPL